MGPGKKRDENEPQPSPDAPDDLGLSLDELSASFARLLGDEQAPDARRTEAETATPCDDRIPSAADSTRESREPDDCPVCPKNIIEAILFVGHPGDEPISARNIASLMRGVHSTEVESLIERLNQDYFEHNCPYMIESVGGGFRMVLGNEFDGVRERFYGRIRQAQLTQAAINTLAIVAYNQPLEKQRIVEMSGDASAGRVLAQLVRRGLVSAERREASAIGNVAASRRTKKPKKNRHLPILYQTTERFLDLFGLTTLSDLPQSHDLTEA